MLISVTHGFLFVHVQKTAGTSLTRLLEPHSLRPSDSRLNKLGSDLTLARLAQALLPHPRSARAR